VVVVLPRTIVDPLIAHTLFVPLGPVEVEIGWLKLTVIVSLASSLPAVAPFAAVTDVATTPSCAAAVGLPETLVHAACGRRCDLRLPGMPLVLTGMVSNVAAILANGGHMPALPSALRAAGLHFGHSRNSALMLHANLSWLVDRWAAPAWIPWANVFSIGDVLIAAGGLLFALAATRPERSESTALRKSLIA
jgi:Family of unknown function (DUF5317)